MSVRTCSWARIDANAANVVANGILPSVARPADTPIRFCSAMPTLKNRSGKASAKTPIFVDFAKSADRATISGCSAPSSRRAVPYISAVDIFTASSIV